MHVHTQLLLLLLFGETFFNACRKLPSMAMPQVGEERQCDCDIAIEREKKHDAPAPPLF